MPMDIDLNDEMRSWLNQLAIDLSIPEEDIPTHLTVTWRRQWTPQC